MVVVQRQVHTQSATMPPELDMIVASPRLADRGTITIPPLAACPFLPAANTHHNLPLIAERHHAGRRVPEDLVRGPAMLAQDAHHPPRRGDVRASRVHHAKERDAVAALRRAVDLFWGRLDSHEDLASGGVKVHQHRPKKRPRAASPPRPVSASEHVERPAIRVVACLPDPLSSNLKSNEHPSTSRRAVINGAVNNVPAAAGGFTSIKAEALLEDDQC